VTGQAIHLLRDREGATIVEFGMVAPILMLALMGLFDMSHNIYTSAILQGAIQKAARDSTIEGAASTGAVLDNRVTAAVRSIMPQATLNFDRKSYTSFSNVQQPEDFTDVNGDGVCGNNEPFEDANGNGMWDRDRGKLGYGAARDAVLYTVTVDYPRLFPMAKLAGMSPQVTTVSHTVLRNQPYGVQSSEAPKVGKCS
jgi:Flp pilus assembly protein TadG